MLHFLISLSDSDINLVTNAVREWCRLHRCDINGSEGRRALAFGLDLVQSKQAGDCLVAALTHRLAVHTDDEDSSLRPAK